MMVRLFHPIALRPKPVTHSFRESTLVPRKLSFFNALGGFDLAVRCQSTIGTGCWIAVLHQGSQGPAALLSC